MNITSKARGRSDYKNSLEPRPTVSAALEPFDLQPPLKTGEAVQINT